jgi:hypothetical protein
MGENLYESLPEVAFKVLESLGRIVGRLSTGLDQGELDTGSTSSFGPSMLA